MRSVYNTCYNFVVELCNDIIEWIAEYLPNIIRFLKTHLEMFTAAFSRLVDASIRLWFSFMYFFKGLVDASQLYDNIVTLLWWAVWILPLPIFFAQVFLPHKWKPSTLILTIKPYFTNFFWFLGYYFMIGCMWIYNTIIYAIIYQPMSWIARKVYNIIRLNLIVKFITTCYNYISESLTNAALEICKLLLAIVSLLMSVFSILTGIRDAKITDQFKNWCYDYILTPVYVMMAYNTNTQMNTVNSSTPSTTTKIFRSGKGKTGGKSPIRFRSPARC